MAVASLRATRLRATVPFSWVSFMSCLSFWLRELTLLVYWYIAWFAVTWGPLAWVVSAEVFPLDMRAKGMSISSAVK
jgi:hypothetical protein